VIQQPTLPKQIVEILITYQNGKGPTPLDMLNPQAVFAWRILHRYFVENQGQPESELDSFFKTLVSEYDWQALSIREALLIIASVHRKVNFLSENTEILIYIGLDEFNLMCTECRCPIHKKSHVHLRHIIEQIGKHYINPPDGIKLVFCMAGIWLEPLLLISSQSGFELKSIPISLIPQKTFINSILMKEFIIEDQKIVISREWLSFPPFRKALNFWSGIPGYSVRFLQSLFSKMVERKLPIEETTQTIEIIQGRLTTEITRRLNLIPYQGLMKLVATSLTQDIVAENNEFLPDLFASTWGLAQSSGLCLIEDKNVKIPLCYLMVRDFVFQTAISHSLFQ